MQRRILRIVLLLASATYVILWATGRVKNPFLLPLALILFFFAANFFGKVSAFSERMRPLIGKQVRVQVWGSALGADSNDFVLHTVRALGAGLHLYLRPLPNGSPKHLKIAQPIEATMSATGVEIKQAKYVQWDGRKLRKTPGANAVVLTLKN